MAFVYSFFDSSWGNAISDCKHFLSHLLERIVELVFLISPGDQYQCVDILANRVSLVENVSHMDSFVFDFFDKAELSVFHKFLKCTGLGSLS